MCCVDGNSIIRTDTPVSLQVYSVRCDAVKSWDIFISLGVRSGLVSRVTATLHTYWRTTVRENALDMLV